VRVGVWWREGGGAEALKSHGKAGEGSGGKAVGLGVRGEVKGAPGDVMWRRVTGSK
jgi:hypothetical protein